MWQHVHIPFRDANMCLCVMFFFEQCLCVMVDHANLNTSELLNLLDNLNLNCGRSTNPCVIRSGDLTKVRSSVYQSYLFQQFCFDAIS